MEGLVACSARGTHRARDSGGAPPHSIGVFLLIECALNGGRTRAEHPGVPCAPQELADSAREAVAAGAGAVHFHVRGRDERESLDADDVARAVEAVRAAIPATPFGVSTGAWIVPDVKARYEKVAAWKVLPPFASINFNEEGGVALAELLLSRGVGIEAGVGSPEAVEALVASGLAGRCLRVMFEPEQQDLRVALDGVERLEKMLERAGVKIPRLLHGLNRTAWDLIDAALQRGYDTRIGFEDVLTLPNGSQAPGNAALVGEAAKRVGRTKTAS
ncbi:MAG: 3-keto-5-aminohexanoate cleavage protein [Candidatus Acidiferrales bacterium]